jgi:hypothetical protein
MTRGGEIGDIMAADLHDMAENGHPFYLAVFFTAVFWAVYVPSLYRY